MYVVAASSAFDVPALSPRLSRRTHHARRVACRSALPGLRVAKRVVALAAQGVVFSAVLWALVAGPGFLTARDSLVPSEAVRTAHHASR